MTFLPPYPGPHPHVPSARGPFPLPAEIDSSNADGLQRQILARARPCSGPRPPVIVLDLSATRFMDSQGVRLINDVRRLLRPWTRVHVVARPESMASLLLELTGVRRDVPVYDNLPEAMAAWN